ncbi:MULTISPECIES: mechanosensitive ion channel family protein [unclassified Vibrio]|uniref:Small-conductance mechanosensitive channel n=1 Tax=Vibrio sp. HB236076 TaxID=3232307 RepID=A0AB39HDT4_9VIBR|nr:mechanosensitive ion channel domain-containing protein [Vibrio sp. HB161653]MDP5253775.1 mechanosensitive ion channel [Vibrio sp. HB161653]
MTESPITQASDFFLNSAPLIVHYGINIIAAVVIFIIGNLLAKLLTKHLAHWLERKNVDKTISGFVRNVTYYGLMAFVLIAVLSKVGIDTASVIAVLGAASLAVGLALKGSLANFASGILIIVLRPFKSGDFIEAAGVSGTVQNIQVFSTLLKTGDNRLIVVPNSSILKKPITNVSHFDTRRINFTFAVSYQCDLNLAQQVIKQVIESDPRVHSDPAVKIGVSALNDSSIEIIARPWVNRQDYWAVYWDMNLAIKQAFDENGIKIPFKQLDVHLHQVQTK